MEQEGLGGDGHRGSGPNWAGDRRENEERVGWIQDLPEEGDEGSRSFPWEFPSLASGDSAPENRDTGAREVASKEGLPGGLCEAEAGVPPAAKQPHPGSNWMSGS